MSADLFTQPKPIKTEQKISIEVRLNIYRRERDRIISEKYYGGKEIPGQPSYLD
jgi:hypothetical protein